ncbi:hypothetical protein D9756_009252 [Leucocoprinus leucothites]|uniref:Uncharacterized protein n=1 Tax=Leucocoprinus leucothites TaxID=201217 RepID=A0A8H5FV68_9AGAR|nr:hypothetical protein D9756_009252 [Leucoagaricus leucothites]
MASSIPPVNHVELDRSKLVDVLEYLGYRIGEHFSHSIRLVVHGGACMLLHPGLFNLAEQQARLTPNMPIRTTTRDVDYIHRAFVAESIARGEPEAPGKLLTCIWETAVRFGLGADWMNSAADVALPMTTDPSGRQVDPIYSASIQKKNTEFHTIFSAANGMLRLISVAPFWAVSFKLVRYKKWDPYDICLLLKYGTIVSKGSAWTRENLERWLHTFCWSMGYANYPPEKQAETRGRIKHAIKMLNEWFALTPTLDEFLPIGFRTDPLMRQPEVPVPHTTAYASREMVMGTQDLDSNRAEWGGGDRTGWKASFAGDWVKPHEKPMQPQLHQFVDPSSAHSHQPNAMTNQPISSSPLNTPPYPPSTNLEQQPRPKVSSNVAEWYAEKQREKQREFEGQSKSEPRRQEQEGEVIKPFNPLLDLVENNHPRRHNSEGNTGFGGRHSMLYGPEVPRRSHSQPAPVPVAQPSFPHQGIYQTNPTPIPSHDHHRLSIYQTAPLHNPPAAPLYISPQAMPPPPLIYHSPPVNINIKVNRRKRGKERDREREKARSAKKWRQTHSIGADGTYLVDLRRTSSSSDSEDDDDEFDNATPRSTPPQTGSPAIYPLTTVVYYNQHEEQQQQQEKQRQREQKQHQHQHQHQQSPLPPPQQPSPPHFSQIYASMAAPAPPAMWVLPGTMQAPHVPQPQAIPPTRFVSPIPMATPFYSQPVIPPQEYTKSERPTGTLQRLMSTLKI